MDWKEKLAAFVTALDEATKDKSAADAAKIVASATDALPQAARQHLHGLGHADGLKDAGKEKGTAAADLAQARKDLEAKDAALKKVQDQLAEKQPDLARQKAEYEDLLAKKDAEVKDAKDAAAKDLRDERAASAGRQLVAVLGTRVLTPELAAGLAANPALVSRLQVGDDGELRAYQADGKTPIAVTTGQTPVEALVADYVPTLDKTLLKSVADGGSGATGGQPGTASEIAAIQADVKRTYGASSSETRSARLASL